MNQSHTVKCKITGIGAWGPGFTSWEALKNLLINESSDPLPDASVPKPGVIPANERRRAPLPVKLAVETSTQATEASGVSPKDLACVFGSGLGDTEITDYMCRVLTTEQKQLSPTKFHNSVHNAAAGYWTISTDCMKSANSVAAYHETAGISLLEAVSQCAEENAPVLISLFDTKAHKVYREIFSNDVPFAASVIIAPENNADTPCIATLEIAVEAKAKAHQPLNSEQLNPIYQQNPAAKILVLLEAIANDSKTNTLSMPLNHHTSLNIRVKTNNE